MSPLMWLLLCIGCGASAPPGSALNPTETEWDRGNRCMDYGELHHCYSLRNSKDMVLRGVALGRACEGHYKDSCQLSYAYEVEVNEPWMAFVAATRACHGGDAELCRIAIHYEERYPEYHVGIRERRPALEARLAELEQAAK
ncbi:MAG: hypothetical protein H6737_08565 [Alphaproteobacteria bacterium]|nr:hypothetical protein [Alphaproteobacteria bacterium]